MNNTEKLQAVYATVNNGDKVRTNYRTIGLKGRNVKALCRALSIDSSEYMESNKYDYDVPQLHNQWYTYSHYVNGKWIDKQCYYKTSLPNELD